MDASTGPKMIAIPSRQDDRGSAGRRLNRSRSC
jgi:hypothetical protein